MIRIHHVLKDGTHVDDVTSHLIKVADHESLYQLMIGIQRKEEKDEESNQVDV